MASRDAIHKAYIRLRQTFQLSVGSDFFESMSPHRRRGLGRGSRALSRPIESYRTWASCEFRADR